MIEKSTKHRVGTQRGAVNMFSEHQRRKFTELGSLRKQKFSKVQEKSVEE